MDPSDLQVRNTTYRLFVERASAPAAADVARRLGLDEAEVHSAWARLHDAHALVLDEAGGIRMANPFAASPTDFLVRADGRRWYANCGWDALLWIDWA